MMIAPIMRRPECLKVFGPRLFGLDEDFRAVEELRAEGNLSGRDLVFIVEGLTLAQDGIQALAGGGCGGEPFL